MTRSTLRGTRVPRHPGLALLGGLLVVTVATAPVPNQGTARGAGALPHQATPAQETGPGGSEGEDGEADLPHPVLDQVEVVETPTIRSTRSALEEVLLIQAEAAHELVLAEGARTEAALAVMSAVREVDGAEQDLAEAEEVLAAEEEELDRITRVEATRLAHLEEARDDLRTLAAAAYASHALEDVTVVGTFEEMSTGPKRRSLRRKVTDDRVQVVDARTERWESAVRARETQEEVVERSIEARDDRRLDLSNAEVARDDEISALEAVTAVVEARRSTHDRLASRTAEARGRHRDAKLAAPVQGTDFTLVGLHAYWSASAEAPCPTPWWLLAGIGRVESHHGTAQGSRVQADGSTSVPIRGIPLDGRPGVAAIGDTDGGLLDGDTTWDRAVGPMQFIPSTWARWATDGDGDGVADPHNLYDAAASAALYLCVSGRGSLLDDSGQRAALLAYNRSVPYGNYVLATGRSYRDALDLPDLATPDPGA